MALACAAIPNGEGAMKNPCFGCGEHSATCHGSCAEYAAFHDERMRENAARLKDSREVGDILAAKAACRKRAAKSARRKTGGRTECRET